LRFPSVQTKDAESTSTDGAFTFTNAAVAARAADPAESYHLQRFRFDNGTAARTPIGMGQTVAASEGLAPTGLLDSGEFVASK
jgi:hypothetical protein